MAEPDPTSLLTRAQRSLEEQRFEEARAAIDEGQARFPHDDKVRDLFQQIHLADGIRRHQGAQDLRRDEIRALGKKERAAYRNSARVTEGFREAIGSLDRVLALDPDHAKTLMLKAGILDRMDREGTREEVQGLLNRALSLHPGNSELLFARDRLATPCSHCRNTGFCRDCQGSGEISALVMKRPCPTCRGRGACPRCGLF
ncbi:MAG: hypothetical protein ACE5LS_06040 [Thermoplasmata archaeon]